MIQLIFDIFVFLVGTYYASRSIKRILHGRYSMLHVCVVIFYLMQIVPILVGYFGDLGKIRKYYEYMYYAMTDKLTTILYDVFALFVITILYHYATKNAGYIQQRNIFKIKNGKIHNYLVLLTGTVTILPLILGVLLAPDPSIYLKFSYFYTNPYSELGSAYIYHTVVIKILCYITFFSILALYYLSNSKQKGLFAIPIILLAWINGKRTLLTFVLGGMIVIDFLKWEKGNKKQRNNIIRKSTIFLVLIVIYYIFYNNITNKASFADGFLLYSTYFSRLSNVKVAIYDLLYTNSMLEYPFQTIIYDVLFFVPRGMWETKPYGYYPYFTSYAYFGVGNQKVSHMAFQVNIWSEFISNAGIFGVVISLILVINIIKKCEREGNNIVYLSGSIFVLLYMMYGFEHIVQIGYILFIVSMIVSFFKKRVKF